MQVDLGRTSEQTGSEQVTKFKVDVSQNKKKRLITTKNLLNTFHMLGTACKHSNEQVFCKFSSIRRRPYYFLICLGYGR